MNNGHTLAQWRALAEHRGAAWEACLQRLRHAEEELAGLRKLCADLQARLNERTRANDGNPDG